MSNQNSTIIQNNTQILHQNQTDINQVNQLTGITNAFLFCNNAPSNQSILENQNQHKNNNAEIISKSIVYGSIAFWLGKKSEQNLTHKWCVYVRGINNEDISYFVKEVVFTLHSTFENNVRTVTKWPYELYASGWGEFDIKITIHLIDETIKPIEFIHFLKLYPPANQTPSTKKPIVSEFFDEIVFVNPKKQLKERLFSGPLISGNIKKDTSIQIPLLYFKNDEDKRSEHSIQEENKNNLYINNRVNNIENKMENLNIGNYFNSNINNDYLNQNNFNSNTQNILEEMEIDSLMNNPNLLVQTGNPNNNDSVSVFSNNNYVKIIIFLLDLF